MDLDQDGAVIFKKFEERNCQGKTKTIRREEQMKTLWRASLILFSLLGVVIGEDSIGASEQYPAKPIICVLAIEAGGDADINARPVMERVSAILGKPIIIVNKPGGGN